MLRFVVPHSVIKLQFSHKAITQRKPKQLCGGSETMLATSLAAGLAVLSAIFHATHLYFTPER